MRGDKIPFTRGSDKKVILSSRISPIRKQAFLAQLPKLINWVGKAFQKAGPEVTSGLKGLWRSRGAAEDATQVGKSIVTSISDDLSKFMNIRNRFTGEIGKRIEEANKYLVNLATTKASQLRGFETQLERVERHIAKYINKKTEIPEMLKQRKTIIESRLKETQQSYNTIIDLYEESSKNPAAAIEYANRTPNLLREGLPVGEWKRIMEDALRMSKDIKPSSYLGDNAKFLQEYLIKKNMPKGELELEKWLSHPDNIKKLEELMRSQKVIQLLNSGSVEVPFMSKMMGITPMDTAKRLGIGAAGIATAGAALKAFSWFNKSNQEITASNRNLQSMLASLGVSDEGIAIKDQALQAVTNINNTLSKLNSSNDDNLDAMMTEYISILGTEHANLAEALSNWNEVIANTADKQLATRAGQSLKNLSILVERHLAELGQSAGISVSNQQIGGLESEGNIMQAQELLGIAPTGKLDANTTAQLQALEEKMNAEENTSKYTGALVQPQRNLVAPIDLLISTINRLKRY